MLHVDGSKIDIFSYYYVKQDIQLHKVDTLYSKSMKRVITKHFSNPVKMCFSGLDKGQKYKMQGIIRSFSNISSWNESCIHSVYRSNGRLSRISLAALMSWEIEGWEKKRIYDTDVRFKNMMDQDDYKVFQQLCHRKEMLVQFLTRPPQNPFFGDKMTINVNGYEYMSSLRSHHDLLNFSRLAVLIDLICHERRAQMKQFPEDVSERKKLSFSARISTPVYQGMMLSADQWQTILMGKKAGSEFFHCVPNVQAELDITLQQRRLDYLTKL